MEARRMQLRPFQHLPTTAGPSRFRQGFLFFFCDPCSYPCRKNDALDTIDFQQHIPYSWGEQGARVDQEDVCCRLLVWFYARRAKEFASIGLFIYSSSVWWALIFASPRCRLSAGVDD